MTMKNARSPAATGDPFVDNATEIAKANLYLLQRVSLGACINMVVLSIISPFLSGFSGAEWLYLVSAVISGGLSLFCYRRIDQNLHLVKPLFYGLLAGLSAYAITLSSFLYPDIHGVTIIAIFVLLPMLILDRSRSVNVILFAYYLISCVCAFWRKQHALAVDDCLTCGAFLVFGMLIGNYMRKTRISAIVQQGRTEIQRDYDELTGLPNRRLLFETLGRIDSGNWASPLDGVFMIDVDDFKNYNDVKGHQAGDECLKQLGALFLRFSEENGVRIFRYGGEEFLGLMFSKSEVAIDVLPQRLIGEVRGSEALDAGITVSIGYALRQSDESTQRLINMADGALYEAKRKGKNRAIGHVPSGEDSDAVRISYRQRDDGANGKKQGKDGKEHA